MDDSSLFLFEYGANLFQQVYLVQALFEHTLQVCVWMGSDGLLEGAPHQEGSRGLYQGPGLVPEEPVPGGNVLHPKSRFGKILTKMFSIGILCSVWIVGVEKILPPSFESTAEVEFCENQLFRS